MVSAHAYLVAKLYSARPLVPLGAPRCGTPSSAVLPARGPAHLRAARGALLSDLRDDHRGGVRWDAAATGRHVVRVRRLVRPLANRMGGLRRDFRVSGLARIRTVRGR